MRSESVSFAFLCLLVECLCSWIRSGNFFVVCVFDLLGSLFGSVLSFSYVMFSSSRFVSICVDGVGVVMVTVVIVTLAVVAAVTVATW